MRTIAVHTRVASFVAAVALVIQISPAQATDQDQDHNNRPVEITFTKWGVTAPPLPAPQPPFGLFEGFAGDGLEGSFGAEILWRQASLNGHVAGLEAMYEVVNGDRSFTALIRGGSNSAGGRLDGVIMAGWRTGARVQVVFQRYGAMAGIPSCEGAPLNKTCFVGTIHVGRAPRD
jgi:anti-sigma factor RsiW